MATLYVYAHNGEQNSNPPSGEVLLLRPDATEISQQQNLEPKVFVYLHANNAIENVETYYILRKFLAKNVDRISHKLQDKSTILTQYNLSIEAITKELDNIILELKGVVLHKNVLKKKRGVKTLFDCLRKSDGEIKSLAVKAKDFSLQYTNDLGVLQAELDKLKSIFEGINATTSLDKMLDLKQKLSQLQASLNSDQFNSSFNELSEIVELFQCAKDLSTTYKSCLVECIRRREFHTAINERISDINKTLSYCHDEEHLKRKEFYSKNITSRAAKEILIDFIFPALDATALPDFAISSSVSPAPQGISKGNELEWIKKLRNEAQLLPNLRPEDIVDSSWMMMNASVIPKQNVDKKEDDDLDDEEVETDDEEEEEEENPDKAQDNLQLCLQKKNEQILQQAKEIDNLKKSLASNSSGELSLTSSAIQSSNRQTQILEEEIKHLKTQLQEKDSEISSMLDSNSLKNDLIEKLKANEQSLSERVQMLQDQLGDTQLERETLKVKFEQEKKATQAQAINLADQLEQTAKALLKAEESLKNYKLSANSSESVLKGEVAALAKEKDLIAAKLSSIEAEKKMAIEISKKQQEAFAKERESLKLKVDELTRTLNDSKQKEELLASERKSMLSKIEAATKQHEKEVNDVLQKCHSENSNKESIVSKLHDEIAQLQKSVKAMEAKATTAQQQADSLRAELAKAKAVQQSASASAAALKPNEVKIALFGFGVDDIVLFRRRPSTNTWEVLNQNAPNYFLSEEIVQVLAKKQGYQALELIRAKVLYVDEFLANKSYNPHNLPIGTKFHIVHIYPFE